MNEENRLTTEDVYNMIIDITQKIMNLNDGATAIIAIKEKEQPMDSFVLGDDAIALGMTERLHDICYMRAFPEEQNNKEEEEEE